MKIKLSKFLSTIILIALATNISVPASANSLSIDNEHIKAGKYVNPNITLMSEELIKKADKYVNIENDEYVLDNSIYIDPMLSESEIKEVKLNISNTNNLLKNNTNKSVKSAEKSIEITFSDQQMKSVFEKAGVEVNDMAVARVEANGINKLESYWWGYYIYLDSYYTGLAVTVATATLAGILAALLPPIAAIAPSVATAMIAYHLGYQYGDTGMIISWNSILGFQKAWSQ